MKIKQFFLSLFANVHRSLFVYMYRTGLVACDNDPTLPREVKAALDRITDQVKEHSDEFREPFESMQNVVKGMAQELVALRASGGHGQHFAGGNDMQSFLESSEALKALREGHTKGVRLTLPPSFMASKAAVYSGGLAAPMHIPEIFGMPRRRMTIRDLMRTIKVDSGSITYTRQTQRQINAAPVSEGSVKPQSNLDLELITAAVVTLAHLQHTSVQAIADIPQLAQFINDELRYGLAYLEEIQILMGSGVGQNLTGLYPLASAYVEPAGIVITDETPVDRLRAAIVQLEQNGFAANGIVLNPTNWASIDLSKDDDKNYILGQARSMTPAVLWGIPVIATGAMTVGRFMVGDFRAVGFLADRQEYTLDIATTDMDDFQRNMMKFRGEERLACAVVQPTAMVKGDLYE